jgi:DNA-binding MarR family transcriptional regulator
MPYGIVQVLYILYLQGPVTQKQISESCETPKQTVNNVIRLFKKEKYITLGANNK